MPAALALRVCALPRPLVLTNGVFDLVQPDLYVKGSDDDITTTPEGCAVLAHGGRAAALPFVHYTSTSELAARIRRSKR